MFYIPGPNDDFQPPLVFLFKGFTHISFEIQLLVCNLYFPQKPFLTPQTPEFPITAAVAT